MADSVRFRTTLTWRRSPRGMAKAFAAARPKAMNALAWHWWKNILPKHFDAGAESRYRYKPRTPKYLERKLKKFGHQRPLVFTGAMERALLRSAEIRVTSKRATIKLASTAPNWLKGYISFRGKRGTGPDKWLEIKRIPDSDANELLAVANAEMKKALNEAKAPQGAGTETIA